MAANPQYRARNLRRLRIWKSLKGASPGAESAYQYLYDIAAGFLRFHCPDCGHEIPHRQFVFTIPKILCGIFHKRRDLILKVWRADPHPCPCCKAPMKLVGAVKRSEQIQFFLRLHDHWEGIIQLPRSPPPPFNIEQRRGIEGVLDGGEAVAVARRVSPPGRAGENQTMKPIEPP